MHDATREILRRYDRADTLTRRRGRAWYRLARAECRAIADAHGVTYRQAAAVLAVTSADTQLVANVAFTRRAIETRGETAGRYPADQVPKVRAILADARRPGRYATGPKVSAFYRAVCGDTSALVIDRWASYAAGGRKDRPPLADERRTLEAAYRTAAVLAGESVRDLQAIVWIACRESSRKVDGRAYGLLDIHEIGGRTNG